MFGSLKRGGDKSQLPKGGWGGREGGGLSVYSHFWRCRGCRRVRKKVSKNNGYQFLEIKIGATENKTESEEATGENPGG